EGRFGKPPVRELPVLGEDFDRMFGVVVVPRDTVVIEEGEQLAPVLLEPLPIPLCDLGPSLVRAYLVEERLARPSVFVQGSLPQAVPVYGFDDLPEQGREAVRQCPELLVEGVPEHIVVEVPQQVDQALLLRAIEGVVGGKKIGDEHSGEAPQ